VNSTVVDFRTIEELQSQNLRLLTLVRELTASREKSERDIEQSNMSEISRSFGELKKELDELRAVRSRQEEQIKTVVEQRNNLTKLISDNFKLKDSQAEQQQEKPANTNIVEDLQKVRKEFEEYRVEKRENERMLKEQCDKLRDDLAKAKSDNFKLTNQVEYNNERVKVYNKNLDTYRKTANVLEERNRALSLNISKLEASLEVIKVIILINTSNYYSLQHFTQN
jgi:nucleoprotein TPR